MPLSIVIICCNNSTGLRRSLKSVEALGDEILIYDTGKANDIKDLAEQYHARLINAQWEGYGKTRWKAAQLAAYDWILMLDTDEIPDEVLKQSILTIDFSGIKKVYKLKYKNFFGKKLIRFGEWGNDAHIRLGNRKGIKTDEEVVHEKLFVQPGVEIKTLAGYILHYTIKDAADYRNKMMLYANLSAEKYLRQGKRGGFLKIFISPAFSFMQNYFFRLGFLDGKEGFICAWITSWYTYKKYCLLKQLQKISAEPAY